MQKTPAPPAEVADGGHRRTARERILDAAIELFYREGIRAVGIDRVIAESGVAKMSLYRNFASKDELVRAFLEAVDAMYWERWEKAMARHPREPRRQLLDFFAMLARRIASPEYRGCPFINTATEFPDPSHPAHAVIRAHKAKLRERLAGLAAAAGAPAPAALAAQLYLLIEGAYSAAQTVGAECPVAHLEPAAAALVAAQIP